MLLDLYRDLLTTTARNAGDAIMAIYEDPERFNVELKGDESPLTAADKAANDIICAALKAATPSIPIVSEESKQIDYAERKAFTQCWMVDPLDGTKEFIKRNGEFTVNIALIKENRSVLGIVYVPVSKETYIAAKGEGAWQVLDDGQLVPLSCREYDAKANDLDVICSRSHLNQDTKDYLSHYQEYSLVPKGSSLKFVLIAQGGADLYPRLGPTMEWDTAAAHIIVEEAGGVVIDFSTRAPLRYNKENLLNPNFIAAGVGKVL